MLFYVSILASVALSLMRTSYFTAVISFYVMNPPIAVAVLYRYRAYLPVPDRLRAIIPNCRCHRENYAPLSTFEDQAAAGMTSSTFDVEADNIFQGDPRAGLDERGTQEVMEIMRRENVKYVFSLLAVLVLIPCLDQVLTRQGLFVINAIWQQTALILRVSLLRILRLILPILFHPGMPLDAKAITHL